MARRTKTPNTPLRQVQRNMKRDALARNRADGCRCPNVRASLKKTAEGVSVLTQPHNVDCVLRTRMAEVEAPITYGQSEGEPLAVPPTKARELLAADAPDDGAHIDVGSAGKLWTPGG